MKYANNIDLLVTCIIYLGTIKKRWGRSPRGLADELGLEEKDLQRLFDQFPNLFRQTDHLSKENGQLCYVLQARHAQRDDDYRTRDVGDDKSLAPLDKDKLELLINFVTQMAEQERSGRRAMWTTSVAASAAVVSAAAAVATALLKH